MPPPPLRVNEVDGTVAYLAEKGESASSLLASTVTNYIFTMIVVLALHGMGLVMLNKMLPGIEVCAPPQLLSSRRARAPSTLFR